MPNSLYGGGVAENTPCMGYGPNSKIGGIRIHHIFENDPIGDTGVLAVFNLQC